MFVTRRGFASVFAWTSLGVGMQNVKKMYRAGSCASLLLHGTEFRHTAAPLARKHHRRVLFLSQRNVIYFTGSVHSVHAPLICSQRNCTCSLVHHWTWLNRNRCPTIYRNENTQFRSPGSRESYKRNHGPRPRFYRENASKFSRRTSFRGALRGIAKIALSVFNNTLSTPWLCVLLDRHGQK